MKKIYLFLLLILVSVILNVSFYSPHIIDTASGREQLNLFIQWPVLRLFIEPFYAFSYYILTLEKSGQYLALFSWIFWLSASAYILAKYKKFSIKNTVICCLSAVVFFASLVYAVTVLPVAGPNITGKMFVTEQQTDQQTDRQTDGLDFYNFCHENIFSKIHKNVVDIYKADKLFAFGGDGNAVIYKFKNMTNVWTVAGGKNKNIKTVVHDVKGSQSFARYVFEPFYFMLNYVLVTPLNCILSFYMFILVVFFMLYKVPMLMVVRKLSLFLSFIFCLFLYYFVRIFSCDCLAGLDGLSGLSGLSGFAGLDGLDALSNTATAEQFIPVTAGLILVWFIIWGASDKEF